MSKFESVAQGAAERLLEDEGLRSNLTDDEANILINWGIEWLEGRVAQASSEAVARQTTQEETARLRPAMQQINDMLKSRPPAPSGIASFFRSLFAAGSNSPDDRKELIRSLIAQNVEAWSKK